ncbi:hypothetical protein [Spirosoma arcticum]
MRTQAGDVDDASSTPSPNQVRTSPPCGQQRNGRVMLKPYARIQNLGWVRVVVK